LGIDGVRRVGLRECEEETRERDGARGCSLGAEEGASTGSQMKTKGLDSLLKLVGRDFAQVEVLVVPLKARLLCVGIEHWTKGEFDPKRLAFVLCQVFVSTQQVGFSQDLTD
jgi:hypothetical protein